jgi:cytochrome c-type biogenesis protein CcmH
MRWLSLIPVLVVLAASPGAFAVQPDEVLADATLETRARALSKELRCMVCQNQSIDDSDAPLARDLRLLVRERLTAGDSDTKVIDFLTARYGEFVLLKPRFGAGTALLWLAPLIALAVGGIGVAFAFRRRRAEPESPSAAEPVLTAAEQARVAELLGRAEK